MTLHKKSLLVAGAIATVGLGSLAGVHAVSAESAAGASLVDKIAQRFSLNKDEVQQVFDEQREARHAEMKQKYEERLTQAVTDGKITEDQKAQILAKHEELKNSKEELKDKTPEERHEAMKARHDELKAWAEENNVPLEYLHPFGGHHGPGHRMME